MRRKKNNGAGDFLIFTLIASMFGIGKLCKSVTNEVVEVNTRKRLKEENDYIQSQIELEKNRLQKANNDLEFEYNKLNSILNIDIKEFSKEDFYNQLMVLEEYDDYIQLDLPKKVENKNDAFLKKMFFNSKKDKIRENEIDEEYKNKLKEYEENEKARKEEYDRLKNEYDIRIEKYNNEIIKRRKKYEEKDEEEVKEVLKEFIDNYIINTVMESLYNVEINMDSQTCVIEYKFNQNIIPKYRVYTSSFNELKGKENTEQEKIDLYKKYMAQTSLKIIEIILKFNPNYIKNVIFNGYIYKLNPAKGKMENMYIISIDTNNNIFSEINVKRVDAIKCIESLGARYIENINEFRSVIVFEKIAQDKTEDKLIISEIESELNGYQFEELTKELLLKDGFENITVTASSGDFGADVIAYKNDVKYAIQCKKYSKPVGVKAVQEVMGSKSMYNCHVAVVLTNNTFTTQAKTLAEKNNVLLWDREKLIELLNKFNK